MHISISNHKNNINVISNKAWEDFCFSLASIIENAVEMLVVSSHVFVELDGKSAQLIFEFLKQDAPFQFVLDFDLYSCKKASFNKRGKITNCKTEVFTTKWLEFLLAHLDEMYETELEIYAKKNKIDLSHILDEKKDKNLNNINNTNI